MPAIRPAGLVFVARSAAGLADGDCQRQPTTARVVLRASEAVNTRRGRNQSSFSRARSLIESALELLLLPAKVRRGQPLPQRPIIPMRGTKRRQSNNDWYAIPVASS